MTDPHSVSHPSHFEDGGISENGATTSFLLSTDPCSIPSSNLAFEHCQEGVKENAGTDTVLSPLKFDGNEKTLASPQDEATLPTDHQAEGYSFFITSMNDATEKIAEGPANQSPADAALEVETKPMTPSLTGFEVEGSSASMYISSSNSMDSTSLGYCAPERMISQEPSGEEIGLHSLESTSSLDPASPYTEVSNEILFPCKQAAVKYTGSGLGYEANFINAMSANLRRVKVYEVISDTGVWCDKGTGRFRVREDDLDTAGLIVESEEEPYTIYVDTIVRYNRDYMRQKDSIITWQDGENPDLYRALSFQHPYGCCSCWTFLQAHAPECCHSSDSEDEAHTFFVLPSPSKFSLQAIIDFLDSNVCLF
ncbi:hypothetical protein IE077_002187 [Cardiosporidium cionae]|uniref:PP4R3 EVH1-like domain-containing protein n=1 Tax=Cardiosporidium cionae TaxID=476202 RepID=A0ABQ7J4I1_9APIC|nr:hypothetical protein IE077_002187 [Cardiosporidium cionae]|eukprot:KAF8818100.1 hypothetical protein IE077_002187 [Cardiosporidium cionae]